MKNLKFGQSHDRGREDDFNMSKIKYNYYCPVFLKFIIIKKYISINIRLITSLTNMD